MCDEACERVREIGEECTIQRNALRRFEILKTKYFLFILNKKQLKLHNSLNKVDKDVLLGGAVERHCRVSPYSGGMHQVA